MYLLLTELGSKNAVCFLQCRGKFEDSFGGATQSSGSLQTVQK